MIERFPFRQRPIASLISSLQISHRPPETAKREVVRNEQSERLSRAQRYKVAESKVKKVLQRTNRWVSAHEVGEEALIPWRCAARALLRLVGQGEVEARLVSRKDENFRQRESRLYRCCPKLDGFPSWMILPPKR